MNKWIIGGTLVATSLIAHAETFAIHIARNAAIGAVQVPAGDYKLVTVKGNSGVMLLEGKDIQTLVFGRVVMPTPYAKPTVELDNLKPAANEPVKLAANNE